MKLIHTRKRHATFPPIQIALLRHLPPNSRITQSLASLTLHIIAGSRANRGEVLSIVSLREQSYSTGVQIKRWIRFKEKIKETLLLESQCRQIDTRKSQSKQLNSNKLRTTLVFFVWNGSENFSDYTINFVVQFPISCIFHTFQHGSMRASDPFDL